MIKSYSAWVQHIANPLHIYCRLIDFGISTGFSRRLSIIYEKYFYHFLLKDLTQAWNLPKRRF